MDRISRMLRAADMSRYASTFASRTTVKARLPLDFSAGSLRIVDRVVDGLRQGAGGADWVGRRAAEGALCGRGVDTSICTDLQSPIESRKQCIRWPAKTPKI
ncbi:hypothetical protein [Streptomyces sp. NBC_01481]|uniref:hypothetical protein n=1 Tax=Streptomyces sp. NBC_01481 TaxID=2975869 RepID=UPI002259169A|nr:hypothetical protein [Streptomyces sp. NBC_01481]MCX4585966.1 hypothetical protein [Streptomyces sp. NBC_01481]